MTKPILTREHGAWAILFVPILTAFAEFGNLSAEFFLITASTCFTFLAFRPAEIFFIEGRKAVKDSAKIKQALQWMWIYAGAATAPSLILILFFNKIHLLLFGIFGVSGLAISLFMLLKSGKSLARDLIGTVWITSSILAIRYSLFGFIDREALILWLLNFLFFSSGAFFVHMKIKTLKKIEKTFSAPAIQSLAFNLLLILILYFMWKEEYIQTYVLYAFAPMLSHALWGSLLNKKIKTFKPLGFTLLGYSIIFTLFFFLY